MKSLIEKRRATIINIVYYAIILVLFYFGFEYIFPLILPFLFAFFIASILNKPIKAIRKKAPFLKRSILSVCGVLLLIGIVAAVFFLVIMELVEKIRDFGSYVVAKFSDISSLVNSLKLWVLDITSFLPEGIRTVLHENLSIFFDNIIENGIGGVSLGKLSIDWGTVLSKGGAVLTGAVGQIPSTLIAGVISIIASVFISSDYEKITNAIYSRLPDKTANKLFQGYKIATSTLKKMIKAYCLIILITTFELTVGLYILKFIGVLVNPYILIIAFITAIIDIIPVLGTGTVLIPWAIYSIVSGKVGLGLGLLIIYVIILVIRQVIEPKLVAGQVGLSPVVTIAAMYIGTKTLGVLGFFILPFVVIMIKVLNEEGVISIFKTAKSTDDFDRDDISDNSELDAN